MQAWSLQTGDQSSSGRADEYIEGTTTAVPVWSKYSCGFPMVEIVDGRQPVGLTSSYLLHHPFLDDWDKQRALIATS